ncbi:MAG: GTP 3',8-cyclase MoaA [Chthoniobacterales bacterium]|jgi:cyclic pyranopterin phosphate synthase
MSNLRDVFGRPMRDLRISVTDRCNFRCPYCMPREVFGEAHRFLPRGELLSFEEIARVVSVAGRLGVRKVRLTGGEPLLRRDLPVLVRQLARWPAVEDLALTTNGLLLGPLAAALQAAGLQRVTVSLDALDDALFRRLAGTDHPVERVLDGIRSAGLAGLPVKINCVIQRGVNEDQVQPLAEWCRREGHVLRFIEYMDVGNHNRWHVASVVPASEIRARLAEFYTLEALGPSVPGEVARRYRYTDGGGEVGFVTSITQPFCGDCNRARLTADGQLVTCLFAEKGADLRAVLRSGASDEEISQSIARVWTGRDDRYSEVRSTAAKRPKIEMSYVGG